MTKELQAFIDGNRALGGLFGAFHWASTPQGHAHWQKHWDRKPGIQFAELPENDREAIYQMVRAD